MATILTKKSDTSSAVPGSGDLTNSTGGAELAVNTADKRIFTKNSGGTVVELGTNPSSITTGTLSATGNVTLGDASGDSVTINASTVSTPNGLNFDSNTLVIDAANNRVGIGTSSPVFKLGFPIGNNDIIGQYRGTSHLAGNVGSLGLVVSDGGGNSGVFVHNTHDGTYSSQDIRFATAKGGVGTATERMRIDSSGNVGVGTSSPRSQLTLTSSTGGVFTLENSSTAPVANDYFGRIQFYSNDVSGASSGIKASIDALVTSSQAATDIVFSNCATASTALTERMRINSSGNLGLGVVPSAWETSAGSRAIQFLGSSLYGYRDTNLILAQNAYFDGSWRYYASSIASGYYTIGSGAHSWYTAASGTAGNAISFTQAMTLDSSGRLGIGTSSPAYKLQVNGGNTTNNNDANTIVATGTNHVRLKVHTPTTGGFRASLVLSSDEAVTATGNEVSISTTGSDEMQFATAGTERMRIDSGGNLGLGVTPSAWDTTVRKSIQLGAAGVYESDVRSGYLGNTSIGGNYYYNGGWKYIGSDYATRINFLNDSGNQGIITFERATTGTAGNAISFTEAMRIDSSGFVGIGRTSLNYVLDVQGVSGQGIRFTDSTNSVQTYLGGYNSTGIVGTLSNHPMTIWTNNTERMRIDSSGNVYVGTTNTSPATNNVSGSLYAPSGQVQISQSNTTVLLVNRISSDGAVIGIYQAGTQEGTISVSGTTVSYNGGHLSRWAQTTGPKDETLVKGTVLSNLDEMNVYVDAEGNPVDNEQLNKVKVSDVEGDDNVAGVFVNWEHDEAHNVDEINMAMTGDMIIRIAQGVTVQRGDLLMSAGDGTAKPQEDDIVRSKTIAKVTSTYVTCTYADGSYCVPCVLMAC